MVNFLKGTLASSLAILLGLAVAIPQAGAVPMLRLSDGTTTFDITDNDVNDTNSALGQVGFSGILGDFNVVVTVGITKPFGGTDLLPIMDIVNMMMTSTTGGNLTISFTEDNFSGPLPSTIVQGFKAEIGGVTAGTVQYQTFLDAGNNKFFQTTSLTDSGILSGGSFSDTSSVNAPVLSGKYALTQIVNVTHSSGTFQLTSFNANLSSVPEPTSMILLGSGLFGLGLWRWKKNTK